MLEKVLHFLCGYCSLLVNEMMNTHFRNWPKCYPNALRSSLDDCLQKTSSFRCQPSAGDTQCW